MIKHSTLWALCSDLPFLMAAHATSLSCMLRLAWFSAVRYNIGGMEFSCNDIEHGVLRGNAPSPASLGVLLGRPRWASNTFKKKDPRARLVRNCHTCQPLPVK